MTACETCRFWDQYGETSLGRGLCRRYAPRPRVIFPGKEANGITGDASEAPFTWWPDTYEQDFCGEWAARQPE